MTRDESRAIAFVGVLLLLATTARFMNRPKPITITAGPVDIQALQAAGRALAEPKGRRRSSKRPPPRTGTTASRRPAETAANRSRTPPVFYEEQAPQQKIAEGPTNINRATAEELDKLPGIGPAVAARIIARRDSLGGFGKVEDLDAVKGIGPALLAKLRPHVVVR